MKLRFIDNVTLKVDFENNEEMHKFNQYFTRDERDANFKKGTKRSTSVKFYSKTYSVKVQLWFEIKRMCNDCDFNFEFDEEHKLYRNIKYEDVKEFCKEQISGTIYQDLDMEDTFQTVHMILQNKFCKLDLSVSYGKTIVLYLASKYLILKRFSKKILITTTKPQLSMQMLGEFSEVNKNNFPFSIWRGGIKIKDAPVVISNFQYLENVKEDILSEFDVIFHDECHRTHAPTYKKIYEKCGGVTSTVGVSGSLMEDRTAEDFKVICNTGETLKRVSKRELIDAGRATDGIICFLHLSYLPVQIRQKLIDDRYNPTISKLVSLEAEKNEILKYDWRAKILAKFAVKNFTNKGNGLIFFKTVSTGYGLKFVELLKKDLPNAKIFYVDENVSESQRRQFQDYAENNNDCIIVGTFDTLGTGTSIKNLHWGMSIEPFKSFNLVEQVIGRFMRLHKNKKEFVWYDVVDDGRIIVNENGRKIMKKNYLYSWMESKLESYKSHGFKIINQYAEPKEKQDTKNNNFKSLI